MSSAVWTSVDGVCFVCASVYQNIHDVIVFSFKHFKMYEPISVSLWVLAGYAIGWVNISYSDVNKCVLNLNQPIRELISGWQS